jgi:hypothetical protein
MKTWAKWTPHEDDFLRKYYGKWHSMQIANALGRPQSAVQTRAKRLNLTKKIKPKEPVFELKIFESAWNCDPFGRGLAVFCIKSITVHKITL